MGQGEDCCRYITVDGAGFHCAKDDQEMKKLIDAKAHSMTAKAVNCDGYKAAVLYAMKKAFEV